MCSVPWECSVPWGVQYRGGGGGGTTLYNLSTVGGYHDTCGGYHEYCMECSVPTILMSRHKTLELGFFF